MNAFSKGNLVDAWRTLMEHFLGLSTPTENSPIPEFLTSGPFTAERALSPEVVSMAYRTAHDVRAVVVHPSAGKFLKITQGALPESAILPLSDGIFRDHSGTKRERALLKNLLDRNISVRLRAYYEIALAAFSLHGGSIDRFQAGISGGHRVSRFREAIESMAPHYQLALVGGQDTLHEIAIAIAGRAQSVRLKSFHAFRKIDSVTFFASASGDLTLSFHLPAGVHLPFVMIRSTGTAPVIDRVVALVQTIGESGDIPWELLRSLGAKIPNPDGTFSEMPGPLPWSVESEKWARALQRIFPSFSRTEIYDRYFMKDQDPHIPGITSSHHARIDLGIPGGGINAEIRIAKDGTTEITILGNIRSWGRKRTFVFGGSTPLGQSEREMLVRGLCRHPGMRGWFGRYWGLRALERAAAESRRATDSKTNDSEGSSLP